MIFDVSETRVDTMGTHCEWLFCTSHNLAACQKDPGKIVSLCEEIILMGYDGICLYELQIFGINVLESPQRTNISCDVCVCLACFCCLLCN